MRRTSLNTIILFRLSICLVVSFLSFGLAITISAQEKDVFPVPESYKVEGIPEIKNSEVKDLFYDPASIRSNLIWDADIKNKRLLITDQTNSVYLLDTPLAQPTQLI